MWAFIFNLILDLCYYLPLEKSVALHLNELEAPPSKDALIVSCLVKNWPSGSGEKIFKYFQYNFTFLLLSSLGEGCRHFAFKSLLRKVLSFMWTKCFVPSNWLKLIHNIFFKLLTFFAKVSPFIRSSNTQDKFNRYFNVQLMCVHETTTSLWTDYIDIHVLITYVQIKKFCLYHSVITWSISGDKNL